MSINKILTKQEFEKSPYKSLMSYEEYFNSALKLGSAFTFARAMSLTCAKDTADNIKDEIKGFYVEKEAKKAEAEERYYAALEQYNQMKSAKEKALKRLEYTTAAFGEKSSYYSDALKKYNLSSKTLFDADINVECARDSFNSANISAFRAFLSTMLT